MELHIKIITILIFAGMAIFCVVSAQENSTSQSESAAWLDYIPLIGVIGTVIGIYSVLDRRKDKKRNARLNEWLDTNVNLSELKDHLSELEGHRKDAQFYLDNVLQVSIQNVALKERAKTQADLVTKYYLENSEKPYLIDTFKYY